MEEAIELHLLAANLPRRGQRPKRLGRRNCARACLRRCFFLWRNLRHWQRHAPAFRFVFFEQRLQALHHLRFLAVEIYSLREVVAKIVEFTGERVRLITALLLEPLWLAVAVAAARINQDPVSLPDGEASVGAVQNRRLADGLGKFLPQQRGQNVATVFTGVRRKFPAEHDRARRQQIHMADGFLAHRSCGDVVRPARDERHAMPAFPRIPFRAAQTSHAAMAVTIDAVVCADFHLADFRAVVAGEDHKRVRRKTGAGQRGHYFANRPVHLRHEIAVVARLAAPFEFRRRDDRVMRSGEREVEEERFGRRLRRVFDVANGARGDFRHDVGEIPTGHHRPGTIEAALRLGRCNGRNSHRAIILDKAVGGEVRQIHAEVSVEAARDRAAGNCFGEIHVADAVLAGGRSAILRRPVPAEMPLADAGRGVTVLPQQRRHGQSSFLNQRFSPRRQHARLQPRTKSVSPREQSVARGRANRVRRVRVGEPDAFSGEAIQIRRGDFGLRVVGAHVAVTEIIGENVNDVGFRFGGEQ